MDYSGLCARRLKLIHQQENCKGDGFNITSWNGHLEHFLTNKIYSANSSQFCFTQTNINESPAKQIDEIVDDLKCIHSTIQHELGLCYIKSNGSSIKVIDVPSD